jgi:DivIVA domain-containing protein
LPNNRSLTEADLKDVRFDLAVRGYRMGQVDRVLRRTAYDLGYKDEMIAVLEAEVAALREGRQEDAELLRKARESAASTLPNATDEADPAALAEDADGSQETVDADRAAPEGPRHARPADGVDGTGDVLLGDFVLPGRHATAEPGSDAAKESASTESTESAESAESAESVESDSAGRTTRA